MSLIGKLEQWNLANVLQKIEAHEKTGLLIVKQGQQWVDLYFRTGRLICIGPLRSPANLGERLLQDKVITQPALQETLRVLGNTQLSETRIALTLMDLGYVSDNELRAWTSKKASEVLLVLLSWAKGEIYFEEEALPPPDRLLVAVSVSSLLVKIPTTSAAPQNSSSAGSSLLQPLGQEKKTRVLSELPESASIVQHIADTPTLLNASSPFTLDDSLGELASSESLLPVFAVALEEQPTALAVAVQPPSSPLPAPPKKYVDISYMRPDMVLMPADLSVLREQNIVLQLTPDQWRLLTRVDGRTSLQAACQDLSMTRELVCQVAAELIAEGLLHLTLPTPIHMNELSPISRELVASGVSNGLIEPGYAATAVTPWSASLPTSDVLPQFSSSVPFETQSQWGNGGNGAKFIPGRGWIANPQPLQPLPSSGPLASYNG